MSRRKQESSLDLLVKAPWWISAILSLVAYLGLRFVLPASVEGGTLAKGLVQLGRDAAIYVAAFLWVIAVFSAWFGIKRRDLVDQQTSLESLRSISWKDFEFMMAEAFRREGYAVDYSLGRGADGGVDLVLRKKGRTSLVQCKQWRKLSVPVQIIREQFGILSAEHADESIVVTSGSFTSEAIAFAQGKPIRLIDGPKLLALVKAVQDRSKAGQKGEGPRAEMPSSSREEQGGLSQAAPTSRVYRRPTPGSSNPATSGSTTTNAGHAAAYETPLLITRPHRALLASAVVFLLFSAIPLLVGVVVWQELAAHIGNTFPRQLPLPVWLPLGMFVVAGLALASMLVTAYLTTRQTLTNQRLIYRSGLLRIVQGELPLDSLEAVVVIIPVFGRLLGYGTVTVTGRAGTRFPLVFVEDPEEFATRLRQAAQAMRSGRPLTSPNDFLVEQARQQRRGSSPASKAAEPAGEAEYPAPVRRHPDSTSTAMNSLKAHFHGAGENLTRSGAEESAPSRERGERPQDRTETSDPGDDSRYMPPEYRT